jgi:hypothetical protein
MEVVECRYRGWLIGWLVEGRDGYLRYAPLSVLNGEQKKQIAIWKARHFKGNNSPNPMAFVGRPIPPSNPVEAIACGWKYEL